jgi:acetyl coenzyme A synthetase (ADP forming)-like protein
VTRPSLRAFFDPRTVAVIGASRDPSKVGGSVLANLRSADFQGRIVPINTRADLVQGLPAFPSLLAVQGSVDLAVVTVPAPAVLPALKECVAKGVPAAVVISAGFRESGEEGQRREGELREWLRREPIRVLGPNCLGWIRPSRRLNVTFAPGMPQAGNIAFVSHSGALAVAILDWARDRRMGFSLFASLGNQADITESDVLAAVARDDETRVIVGYLEGVAEGRRFFETLREAASLKPVVLLKAGRSAEGARAVSSHTGALAGSDRVFDAAVKQAGAVRAETVEELFDLARGLTSQRLPRGRRLLIVTNGGGLGIVSTDAARESGLEVAPLDDAARRRLTTVLPAAASVVNPVDLVGDADAARYNNALHAIGADAADAALVVLTAQAATDAVGVARAVIGATRGWPIPLVAAFVGGARVAAGARALEDAGIPCYAFPEPAVKTLAGMALLAERRARPPEAPRFAVHAADANKHLGRLIAARRPQLDMLDLAPLLDSYGIPCATPQLAATAAQAAAVARNMGCPVALKVRSAEISHKTEVGGVRLGLRSADEVTAAATEMLARVKTARPTAVIEGVLVQPMVEGGKELLLGMVRDAQFGPAVMVGFGGVYVEVLRDTAMRLCPLQIPEARAMLGELRMAPLLQGVRGEAPVDMDALSESICRVAQLAVDLSDLAELEVNPLVAGPGGVIAVDARASLAPQQA